jgi:hypothetical protein
VADGPVPYLRVVRGDATPAEIAALVTALAVTAARSAAAAALSRPAVQANWNSRARTLRGPVHPSAGGWRRSALP